MPKKRRKRRGLGHYAEEFAISLIFEASGSKIGRGKNPSETEGENPVAIRDRIKLLDSITKLLGAQDTPEEEEEDGLTQLKDRLNDSNSGAASSGANADED